MERLEILSDEVTEGRVMLEWKRNGLNAVIGSWTADGGRRAERIEVCYNVTRMQRSFQGLIFSTDCAYVISLNLFLAFDRSDHRISRAQRVFLLVSMYWYLEQHKNGVISYIQLLNFNGTVRFISETRKVTHFVEVYMMQRPLSSSQEQEASSCSSPKLCPSSWAIIVPIACADQWSSYNTSMVAEEVVFVSFNSSVRGSSSGSVSLFK